MPNKKIDLPSQIDLNQFISFQAHDLRTPFNHITGFSKMLLNTLGSSTVTELQKEDLGTVYRSGMRALSLMNGLIDIARLNQHEKEPNLRELDTEQVIAQGLAQWKKFNPGVDIQTDFLVRTNKKTILGDEQLLRQIIAGFTAFVALYCEAKTKITISVTDRPDWCLFAFESSGQKAHQIPQMDRDIFGYVNCSLVNLQKGEIQQLEETDNGAIVKFVLPSS